MRLILLGPPGAGKGTQAAFLAREYGILKLSTGDMLRSAAQAGDEFGENLRQVMSSGGLVADSIIIDIIRKEVSGDGCAKGFILDGFPRTVVQAQALDTMLEEIQCGLDSVIELVVDHDALVERISGRFSCDGCGEGYHDSYKPLKKEGICDVCGGVHFTRREDDNAQTVAKRLRAYQEQTAPLLPYYEKKHMLRQVDGMLPMQQVEERIREILAHL